MPLVATDNQNYFDIADAIREKNGSTDEYRPDEMAEAIRAIAGSAGEEIPALDMPAMYAGGFRYCRENLYTGDFAEVMFMYFEGVADTFLCVVFLMDDFEILSYDPYTTEFTAVGWYSCVMQESNGAWTTADYRNQASTGGNYIKNVKYSTCYLEYGGETLFPVPVMTGLEADSVTFDDDAGTCTVNLATGQTEVLTFVYDDSGNVNGVTVRGRTVTLGGV